MRQTEKSLAGQSMRRVSPSTIETVGRVDWKSKNSSGSIEASGSASSASAIAPSAVEAEAAASFQPRKAQTITGERSGGTSPFHMRELTLSA